MKPKFKVGDKVRVIDIDWSSDSEYIGKIYTIKEVNPKGFSNLLEIHYSVVENDCSSILKEYQLELIKTDSFTKSDLENGMVVEYRNGLRRMFFNGLFITKDSYFPVSEYDEKLIHVGGISHSSELDIKQVYIPDLKYLDADIIFKDKNLRLVWDRDGIKEMTLSDIEKALGYKIMLKEEVK